MTVFSAHGVAKKVEEVARERGLPVIDATCPLVSKVHREAERHHEAGRTVVLIGHAGHPEVVGTMGQLPDGAVALIETVEDARVFTPRDAANIAFVTQTTLSVDDTAGIVAALRERFPTIAAPHKDDICYATTNRQEAVKTIAAKSDVVLVIGSANSSNSVRLVEVARREGVSQAHLIDDATNLDFSWIEGAATVGVTAGASAPEVLVQGVIDRLAERFAVEVVEVDAARETVSFKLPRVLA
jgi:4-hydroxy-3-methylbut-2-enyl diphosphate reductase